MIKASPHNPAAASGARHIYVHIPFCARICPYCAFYKERADPAKTDRFLEAMLRELAEQGARLAPQPETIFFGGGTPTALSTAQLDLLLTGLSETLDLSLLREWTVEANPGSVSPRKVKLLRDRGVNRISLGVQSWEDRLLQVLGREHNAAQAEESFRILRGAGCENVSIDLMFGLPGQTLNDWERDLARAISLGPDHISTYCLTFEEDTDFFLRQQRGELQSDPDADAEFFRSAMRLLAAAGYEQYEISNYARLGFESMHNRSYWAGENYLGIGPSAFSTIDFQRWQNVADYRAYADRVLAGQSAIGLSEALNSTIKRAEQIALSLRTREGVPSAWLDPWPNERREFIALDLLREANDRAVLTEAGRMLADSVAEAFV